MEIQLKTNQYSQKKQHQKVSPVIADEEGRILLRYESVDVEGQCILLQVSPIILIGWRYTLFVLSNVLLFIPWLLTFWYPRFKRVFYFDYCSLRQATHFYVQNYDEQVSIVLKQTKVFMVSQESSKLYSYFVNRYMTYIIDDEEVVKVSMYTYRNRIAAMMKSNRTEEGLSEAQAHQLKNTYGPGTMEIQKPHCLDLTIREILRPLYLFLLFSVSYWTWDQKYFYFAGTLFFVSMVGLVINLYQMMTLNNKIFNMAFYEVQVNVLRSGKVHSLSSLDVVPGDIVFLKDPIKIPFQGIILQGSALINECALTGESVPVVKKADSQSRTSDAQVSIDKNSFVYEGTTIIQVNDKKKMSKFQSYRQAYGVPVCVVRTNFVTTKGQLIRIILFPKQQENIFQKESSKYLIFLFVLSVSTFIVLIILIHDYVVATDLVQKFFDLITITVPPALPVSMTFGIIYAIDRLESKSIFCIAQSKVIAGGMIEFCCFDKTGTLTEDYMDFYALIPSSGGVFNAAIPNNEHSINRMLHDESANPNLTNILFNMASNNSIIKIETTSQLIGDPMEIKTFLFGRFNLNQSHADPDVIFGFDSQRGHKGEVYRRFQFDADLQRMSVVCHISATNSCKVYAKGSPEMMLTIMMQNSIPKNYQDILKEYASHGFRVLAIASKSIVLSQLKVISRADAEHQLTFNGFQVFENKLKPQTKGAIAQLKAADIGCVMITGDNTLTGSNISYKCNISSKNKGMIICDYSDGKFSEENFNFQDDEQTTQISTQKPSTYPHQNTSQVILTAKTKIENVFVEESIKSEFINTEHFMDSISQKAESMNCQLCITGRAFNELFPGIIVDLTPSQVRFMDNVSVFARTKPNDKAKIVMAYQHMDRKVSMCGDGANDCGALKQADIGLSLSQAQASISAPFTSQVANITSMVQLIKQCRAGLATNFALFNIMAIYSLIEYTTTVICEKYLQYPADLQYLYWDLVLNFFFILFIGYTATAKDLSVERPRSSLFSFTNLMQMLFAFGAQVAGQIAIIAIYQLVEPDYYYANGGMGNAIANYESGGGFSTGGLQSNVLFIFTNNIYVITMLAFNIARPWRAYFFTNIPLMVIVILTTTYNQMLFLWEAAAWDQFQLAYFPSMNIRWTIFGVSWAFSLVIFINQKIILQPLSAKIVKAYPHVKWL